MKTLTLSTIALVAFAGAASAATNADFERYDVDVDNLTPKQELLISNAIASGDNYNETNAAIRAIVERG